MKARIISTALLIAWLIQVLRGKGGFVHLLLLSSVCVAMVEVMTVYRGRMRLTDADKL